ncbi:MAG: aminotransferase class V-fold PLP-dependent enzyme [Candidatus Nitronauta litoralis]|uniref:2-aminoethylphosphonate--pyruvate transaminase n=1 Tax=Candidatus Nitronauta litoralis TaxID=2705533 RepID=A0A7T0BT87_9BACT|nr:MAG: aminotransferase class V-fold PLP-dependent enzyme [Candidatus Nitronauta litoralis]
MNRIVLLNPGPVNVTDTVRDSLHRGDMCHREQEIADLIQDIRRKLLIAFDIEGQYRAALISGSGTAALEMGVSSCLSEGKTLLVIENGVYGERISKMADAYGHNTIALNTPWGTPPDLDEIEKKLAAHPDIEVVGMVHHETTTGLMNPLDAVYGLCQKYDKRLLIDAISSIGGETFNFSNTPADIVIGTANKCIQGYPGVSFVLSKISDWDRLERVPARSLYCNLFQNLKAQDKGDTLFTPAIQVHYALDQALDELIEETVEGRITRYNKAANFLRQGYQEIGLDLLLPVELLSNTITALKLPDGMTYEPLHDYLREKGFVIYAGQGNLSDTIFRIANMGDIRQEEFERLLVVLRECVHTIGKA